MFSKIGKELSQSKKSFRKKQNIVDTILCKIKNIDLRYFSDKEFSLKTEELIKSVCKSVSNEEILVDAFALVFEAVYRVLGIKPFDCQLIAGIYLYNNRIIEMQTGEGKTLSAVFAAYLAVLEGKGVHILTFNDYLARRDAAWMGPVYNLLGVSVGYINEGMNIDQRKSAYACDITYVTAKEAGYDYLRDSLSCESDNIVHRPFNFAIVDEADSIMIDEAKIPLVIATGIAEDVNALKDIFQMIKKLQKGLHYNTDEYLRNVYLTERGIQFFETAFKCGNLYENRNFNLLSDISSALHAEVLLHKDIDYIVKDGRLELVDEFTGRVVENRHWPDRLQTAVEVKEGIDAASKGKVMSSISIQNFINLYPKVSGMTGTALSSKDEFMNSYGIETVIIPRNRICVRIDHPDYIYQDKESKFKAVIKEIMEVNKTGRPILIGSGSIAESERLTKMLNYNGIKSQVLNAKNDEFEALIIANAGTLGAVTVSTNMAGRGTDIRLGGNEEQDREKVVALGGLYVIGTNRHESIRIDNQLRGRAGRQGDPGSSRFFISLEDDIFKKNNAGTDIQKRFAVDFDNDVIDNSKLLCRIAQVQRTIEGQNYEIRKTLWRYTDIIEQQRKIIFKSRAHILNSTQNLNLLKTHMPEFYKSIEEKICIKDISDVERYLSLYVVDKCWAEYLEHVSYLRDGIHLVIVGGKNPLEEYIHNVIESFNELREKIRREIISSLEKIKLTENGIDLGISNLKGPSSTWTYLINDNPFEDDLGLMLASNKNIGFSAVAAGLPFVSINLIFGLIYQRFFKRNRHVR